MSSQSSSKNRAINRRALFKQVVDPRDQTRKHNNSTNGAAQQNASKISPETRSIGRPFTTSDE
jgi:hypothetical protein